MKHITFYGIDLNTIDLDTTGKDDNCVGEADRHGNCFNEHSFLLEDNFFDEMVLRVWEDQEPKPEYIWLNKRKCGYVDLNKVVKTLTDYYGDHFYGNKECEPDDETRVFTFTRGWDRVFLEYSTYNSDQLSISFRFSARDRQESSFSEDE